MSIIIGEKRLAIPHFDLDYLDWVLEEAGFSFETAKLMGNRENEKVEQRQYHYIDGSSVHFILDNFTGSAIFEIHGDDISIALQALMDTYLALSFEQIIERVNRTAVQSDKVYYLYGLGLTAREDQSDIASKVLTDFTTNESNLLRKSAAFAMGFTEWPLFLPTLGRIAVADESDEVREMAAVAIDVIQRKAAISPPAH